MENKNNNYNYVFWNNTYENKWYAIPTTEYLLFFNGSRKKTKGVLTSSNISTLLNMVEKQK